MKNPIILSGLALLCLNSCSNNYAEEASTEMDSTATEAVSQPEESAAKTLDTARKFVRTADIRFQAENAAKATVAIEDAVNKCGGFVTLSDLSSDVVQHETREMSQDSVLDITEFRVSSTMEIRVPSTSLDTVMKTIAQQVKFLDSRSIKADDVRFNILANSLKQKRLGNYENRLSQHVDKNNQKLNQSADVEDAILNKKEGADDAFVANLDLLDQVNYSTVSIEIYQPEQVRRVMMENTANDDKFRPSIFARIGTSLHTGWMILENSVVGLLSIWPVLLIAVVGYFGIRNYTRKQAKLNASNPG